MKRITVILLAVLLALSLFSCAEEENTTTEAGGSTPAMTTCAISYPTLLSDGGIQMSSMMDNYASGTMEDALKGGLNGRTTVTFDEEGNIASIGDLKAEGGYRFMIRTIASNGQPTVIDKKPADITLEFYASYEVYYADAEGMDVTYLE